MYNLSRVVFFNDTATTEIYTLSLHDALPISGISTEQLRSRLNRMVADGLLTRQRYREVPPRVDYELTERSRELMPVLGALARWGLGWAWSPPRDGEDVKIGAILRLAPGLVMPPRGLEGTVEAIVDDEGVTYLTLAEGVVTVSEAPPADPDRKSTRLNS